MEDKIQRLFAIKNDLDEKFNELSLQLDEVRGGPEPIPVQDARMCLTSCKSTRFLNLAKETIDTFEAERSSKIVPVMLDMIKVVEEATDKFQSLKNQLPVFVDVSLTTTVDSESLPLNVAAAGFPVPSESGAEKRRRLERLRNSHSDGGRSD